MGWFWERDEKYSDKFNNWYENEMIWIDSDGSIKKGTKAAHKDDKSFTAGESLSDKTKILANKMYENEDKVIEKVTQTAKKVVGISQNLALLAICAGGLYVYIKYFKKGAKK